MHCEVTVTKKLSRYVVGFYKDGKRIRENVWAAQSMVREALLKSGALPGKTRFKCPLYLDQTIVYPVHGQNWFWHE